VSTWVFWWLIISILTTVAVMIVLIALARHAMFVGRSAKRFQEEVAPLAEELNRGSAKISEHTSKLEMPRRKDLP
jgi:hypothetical protein